MHPVRPRFFRFPRPPALLLCLSFSLPVHALTGLNADGSLNQQLVTYAYMEGDFKTVMEACETFRKSGIPATRDDSIFVYKHLSVVYAKDPATRAKAESFMFALLSMMPTIDLLDLYISANIEAIFNNVKSNYERMQKLKEADAVSVPSSPKPVAEQSKMKSTPSRREPGVRPWVWAALGGGVAAVTATYFLVRKAPEPGEVIFPVDL